MLFPCEKRKQNNTINVVISERYFCVSESISQINIIIVFYYSEQFIATIVGFGYQWHSDKLKNVISFGAKNGGKMTQYT